MKSSAVFCNSIMDTKLRHVQVSGNGSFAILAMQLFSVRFYRSCRLSNQTCLCLPNVLGQTTNAWILKQTLRQKSYKVRKYTEFMQSCRNIYTKKISQAKLPFNDFISHLIATVHVTCVMRRRRNQKFAEKFFIAES